MINYIDEIFDKSTNKKLISVDIFDTLLLRDGKSEETRFYQSAIELKKIYPDIKLDEDSIFKTRFSAHHTLYHLYKQGVITEPSIDSILSYQSDLLNSVVSLDKLLVAETNVELKALSVNKLLASSLKKLSKNATIVLLSDMYLSSHFIKNILNLKNVNFKFDLYVSNELKKSKHKGDAFPWLIDKYNLSYKSVLHVGDNYSSDVIIPSNLLIDTVFTPRSEFFYLKESVLKRISNITLRKKIYVR